MSEQLNFDLNYLSKPTTELLDDLGAGNAAPGSGSAAALLGLISANMIITVCKKSLTKPECKESFSQLRLIQEQVLDDIAPQLKVLFEKDAEQFDKVIKLRIEAKNSENKKNITRKSNDVLQIANDYVFDISNLSLRLMQHGISIFKLGWHAVRGDSGVAISSALSSVMSSIFIINLNLKKLNNRIYAQEHIGKIQKLEQDLQKLQSEALACVTSLSNESLKSIPNPPFPNILEEAQMKKG